MFNWIEGFKTANDEQNHQASEKLPCYKFHFVSAFKPPCQYFCLRCDMLDKKETKKLLRFEYLRVIGFYF